MKGLRQTVANLFQGLGGLKVRREPEGIFSRSVHGRVRARDFGSIPGHAGRNAKHTPSDARKPSRAASCLLRYPHRTPAARIPLYVDRMCVSDCVCVCV